MARSDRSLTESEQGWLDVRATMRRQRFALSHSAATLYPEARRVEGTPLLTTMAWIPRRPLPLVELGMELVTDPRATAVTGREPAGDSVLPIRPDRTRHVSYAAAMNELAPPSVFENRPTYRLLQADLATSPGRLVFGRGRYFDSLDVGESVGHEFTAAAGNGLRSLVGDPCDPARRPTNLAISALTIRHDRLTGDASFPLHWRDPAKVGHAGGLYQVVPVGVFQPSSESPGSERADFSLWRFLLREFAEELLGEPERTDVDYADEPFGQRMTEALHDWGVRAYCLGLGVDPLTFSTDLLVAVVVEAAVFDELFAGLVTDNAEGIVLPERIPFDEPCVERFARRERMQAAGAAALLAAWRHRALLLGPRRSCSL